MGINLPVKWHGTQFSRVFRLQLSYVTMFSLVFYFVAIIHETDHVALYKIVISLCHARQTRHVESMSALKGLRFKVKCWLGVHGTLSHQKSKPSSDHWSSCVSSFQYLAFQNTIKRHDILCYGPTRAKMSGDVLAMKRTCYGGDRCRWRTCGPTRKLTRDILTNLRGSITDASPNIRRCIGEY